MRRETIEIDIDIEQMNDIVQLLQHILHYVRIIARSKHHQHHQLPTAVQIQQVKGGTAMAITGTNVGGSSTFEADALVGGVADPTGFPAGSVDTWTVDDPTIGIGPDSGPNGSQVVISLPSGYAKPDYGLTVSVQMPAGADGTIPAPLTMTVRVPAIAAPPPVPDGVSISQVA